MKHKEIAVYSFLSAFGVVVYISLLYGGGTLLENIRLYRAPNILSVLIGLMAVVLSAGVTGSLVLGKPVMLYIDGKKKDALKFLAANFIWLAIFLILAIVLAAIYTQAYVPVPDGKGNW